MRPEAFHLELGMSRSDVESALNRSQWTLRPGKEPGQLLFDYDEGRTVTLTFEPEGLQSIRFELVDFIPALRGAFDELKAALEREHGRPDRATEELVIYDRSDPDIYVVVSTRPDSSFGRQGLGFLAARYFRPAD